jgi:hypothetical protein
MKFEGVAIQFGDSEQLDTVADFLCEFYVAHVELIDSHPWNLFPMHASAKRQMCQDCQFLRCVAAIDIKRWIGLGITELLRFFECVGVCDAFFMHLAQDEICRAVENAVERQNLVCRQALTDICDDRDAAGD